MYWPNSQLLAEAGPMAYSPAIVADAVSLSSLLFELTQVLRGSIGRSDWVVQMITDK